MNMGSLCTIVIDTGLEVTKYTHDKQSFVHTLLFVEHFDGTLIAYFQNKNRFEILLLRALV